jgi:putative inorganic carbon (hco3(-)) transporter
MRSILLLLTIVSTLPFALMAPQIGVLMWSWVSFMSPQELVFGFILPYVYIIAMVTALAWLASREPKGLPRNLVPWILVLFMLWMTLSAEFALDQARVWDAWNRDSKNMLLGLAIMAIMTNRVRMHALLWVIVLSIGYFALKGGIFVVVTGGGAHVEGPPGSMINDNNNLALAMVMTWPFINYLRLNSANKFIRLGLAVLMGVSVVAILGTYSRGGFIALAAVLSYFWWKSRRKITFAICGAVVLVPVLLFMPQKWVDRMNTINAYQEDASAVGRLQSWELAFRIALDRPLVGVGFEGITSPVVAERYVTERRARYEAHSIWFQTMSDGGFVGFGLFLLILGLSWHNASVVRRTARGRKDLVWARDLATMCQVSLAGYAVAGSFLSMAYYDVYWAVIAILAVLRDYVRSPVVGLAARPGVFAAPLGLGQIAPAATTTHARNQPSG